MDLQFCGILYHMCMESKKISNDQELIQSDPIIKKL